MPELPEVETVRRQLTPFVVGKDIKQLKILDPRWCAPLAVDKFSSEVTGKRVEALERRGKYLIWRLSNELFQVTHLRMTGTFLYGADTDLHVRVSWELSDGKSVTFNDPRRFGTGLLVKGSEELDKYFKDRLGPEPFDQSFDADYLKSVTKGKRGSIKALLLDQKKIAGVGNIYADEALFKAKIKPQRVAGRVTKREAADLVVAIREALTDGIDSNGATIDDFRHVDGAVGSYQSKFLVHRREAERCPNCSTQIKKIRVAGRGTYLCTNCQR